MKRIISVITLTIFTFSYSYAETAKVINAAAHTAMGVNMVMTINNTEQGKTFAKRCSGAWVYCGMAVLAFAQAALALKDAAASGKTKAASECIGSYCGGSGGGSDLTGTGDVSTGNLGNGLDPITGGPLLTDTPQGDVLGKIQTDLASQLEDLKNKGYSYDPATNSVNTPNNGAISASTFGSADGLKSLGMSDAEISNVQKLAADALKTASKYKVNGGDYESFGGGKKTHSASEEDGNNAFDMNKYLASLSANKAGSRGVAGLEKKFGSDQIGVAQDNIFTMIHRRYEAKKPSLNP